MTLNQVILIGHIGNDPEGRYSQTGDLWATMSLATNSSRNNTEWHKIKAFGQNAKFAIEHIRKGDLVTIQGSIRYETWTGDDGRPRHTTSIMANTVSLLHKQKDTEPL